MAPPFLVAGSKLPIEMLEPVRLTFRRSVPPHPERC